MDGNQDQCVGQHRFALAFEKMPVAWAEHRMVYDGEGKPVDYEILDVNPAFERFTGLACSLVIGKRVTEVIPWLRDVKPDLIAFYGAVVATGEQGNVELYVEPLGRFYAVTAFKQGDDGLVAMFENVTARKRAEDALQKSEARFRAAFEQSMIGLVTFGLDGSCLRVNARLAQILGYPCEELLTRSFRDFTGQSGLAPEQDLVRRIDAGEMSFYSAEARHVRKDGNLIWLQLTASLVRGPDNSPAFITLIVDDVSARKQAEAEVARLAAIVEGAEVAIIGEALDGTILTWNDGARRLFGYTAKEMVGRSILSLIPPDREGEERHIVERLQRAEPVEHFETVRLHQDGHLLDVSLTVSPIREPAGRIVGASKIARDISERRRAEDQRKLAEEAMRSSEERYRVSFEQASVGQALVGLDGRMLQVNGAFAGMLGYRPDELRGMSFAKLTHPDDLPQSQQVPAELLAGREVHRLEKRYLRKDGTHLWAELNAAPWRNGAGRPIQFVVHIIDISERKRMEERLRNEMADRARIELELMHSQKLQAIGQIAAGIAHEINTPLQFIQDNVTFLREAFGGIEQLIPHYRRAVGILDGLADQASTVAEVRAAEEVADLEYLGENLNPAFERCVDGLARVSSIVRAMKEFAHPDQGEKSLADLNRALERTLLIAKNEYKSVAEVETEFGDIPLVSCHIGDLSQVFLNIVVNAAYAISDVVGKGGGGSKGRIRVRTQRDASVVRIDIADTGAGIPDSVRERIFEPFFTTKPVGAGSGQGLAIARSIVVDKHGGSLTFASAAGQGTTFTIQLPIGGEA